MNDPLTAATEAIHALCNRKARPLSWLEACFEVTEAMDTETATEALQQLIARRYLDRESADIAQMLATRLGIPVQWSHMPLIPGAEWKEGRGQ